MSAKQLIFSCIVIVAIALRFWQLGTIPASVDWDEAALGYNAFSLLKTGRDEYGTRFPLVIRSFDDYKPPLYTYITIPAVGLFGLNPWSVRLPSAFLGVLAVIGVFFLTKELLKLTKIKDSVDHISFLSMFFLAISPWHIQFSRIAFEANIGVTINIWAILTFLRGLSDKKYLYLSAFLFGLSIYAYHSERIFMPLLGMLLIFIFRYQLLKNKKHVLVAGIIACIVVAPLVPVFFNPVTLVRLRGTSSLADQTGLLAKSVRKIEYDIVRGDRFGGLLDNRRFVWMNTLLDGYVSHFSLKWLFLAGDNARHHAPDMGLLYIWELPFVLWGMFFLAQKGGKSAVLLFGWFIIAPVAASPTTELPHAIRSLVFLPTFQIFTALGVHQLIAKAQSLRWGKALVVVVYGCLGLNIMYYLHMYFYHMDNEYSKFWQYGYQKAVQYTEDHKNLYKQIVVSTKLEQPHMFFLFYSQYDPVKYLSQGGTASGGFEEVRNAFDNYQFRPIDWDREVKDGSILYIGTPKEIPGNALQTIHFLNGEEAIKIAKN